MSKFSQLFAKLLFFNKKMINSFKNRLTKTDGSAIILLAFGAGLANLILVASVVSGVNSQKNLQRNIQVNSDVNKLMNQVTSIVLKDLKLGARFPDAVDLPGHALSPFTYGSTFYTPCASKPSNNKYNLDAFLQKTCQKEYPSGGYTGNIVKNFTYSRSVFLTQTSSRGHLMTVSSDPFILLRKIRTGLYSLAISFLACPKSNGTTCQTDLKPLAYEGIVNTATPFFQDSPSDCASGVVINDVCQDLQPVHRCRSNFDTQFYTNHIYPTETSECTRAGYVIEAEPYFYALPKMDKTLIRWFRYANNEPMHVLHYHLQPTENPGSPYTKEGPIWTISSSDFSHPKKVALYRCVVNCAKLGNHPKCDGNMQWISTDFGCEGNGTGNGAILGYAIQP